MLKLIDPTPPEQCIFCRLIKGEIPASRVHEDALTVAFMDVGQVNPGHLLVAVKRHAATLLDITPEEAAAVMQTARRLALAIEAAFAPPGITLLQANGKAGEQTVFHFHLHLLPRHEGDGVGLAWSRKTPPREELEAYAARIRAALR